MTRELETADGRRSPTVFRSCAQQIGLPLEVVVRAAATGRLGALIQARSGRRSTVSPARPGMGARTGDDALAVLAFKRDPEYRRL